MATKSKKSTARRSNSKSAQNARRKPLDVANLKIAEVAPNPRREGTRAFKLHNEFKKGVVVAKLIEKSKVGMDTTDLNYAVEHGHIKLVKAS